MQFDISLIVWLLLIASIVAILAQRIRGVPYAAALVVTGLVVGIPRLLPQASLNPHILFTVLLPPLLFEAAIHLRFERLREILRPLSILALAGTVLAAGVTGGLVAWLLHLPLLIGLIFGALIAPTDPISVIAVFRQLRVDRQLALLLESESLFNDGVAVVLFTALLGGISQGHFPIHEPILLFIATMLGGIAVGAAIGLVASYATRSFEDPLLEITLTTIVAYGAYVAADTLHVSGVVAVVAAGLAVGNYGMRANMSAATRLLVASFWEYAAFLVNSIVFLLIGINEAGVFHFWAQPGGAVSALVAVAAMLTGRAVVVYGLSPLVSKSPVRLPWSWRHVLFWGGLHGALSMALALGLVLPAAYRAYYIPVVALTYSAVLFSLLVQGLTIAPLLRRLGFSDTAARFSAFQRLLGELLASHAGLTEVKRMQQEAGVPTPASEEIAEEFRRRITDLEKQIETLYHEDSELAGEQRTEIRRQALLADKNALHEAEQAGLLEKDDYRALSARIDETLEKLMQDDGTDG